MSPLTGRDLAHRLTRRSALLVLLAGATGPLAAQHVGPLFRVNTDTSGGQGGARIAYDTDGRFVVVWSSDPYGPMVIEGQRFTASGAPLGPEFRVNQAGATAKGYASIASSAGQFVVVWAVETEPLAFEIVGRRFGFDGLAIGGEFRVNGATTGTQYSPSIASRGGAFTVVWSNFTDTPQVPRGVHGRRFDSQGTPLTSDFRISTYTTEPIEPSIAIDGAGRMMAMWGDATNLWGQRFLPSGGLDGGNFYIDNHGTSPADLAAFPAGGFVVASSGGSEGSGNAVAIRRFNTAGDVVSAFRINTITTGDQEFPEVTVDPTGAFLAAWRGPDFFTKAQFFGPLGAPVSGEFTVGPFPAEDAAAATGAFTVVGSSGGDIFAQRLSPPPVAVTEFRANASTTGQQRYPSIVEGGSGDFVVAWRTENAFAVQRFNAAGAALGTELAVPALNGYVGTPRSSLASDSAGGFVLVWDYATPGDVTTDIYAQRISSSGTALSTAFRVNSSTSSTHQNPSVAPTAGGFVVIWGASEGDGDSRAVFGRRFTSGGQPIATEFVVNSITTGDQRYPAVASNSSGGFVVIWTEQHAVNNNLNNAFTRRFSSSGSPVGLDIRVNTHAGPLQQHRAVGVAEDGSFVVVWAADTLDGSLKGIAAQRFSSSGAPLGAELLVNTYTTSQQGRPAISVDAFGRFVIAWGSQIGTFYGVFEQVYQKSGEPLGGTFRVNATTFSAAGPAVALGKTWVTAWGQTDETTTNDVRILLLTPPCRSSDADGNGSINVVDILTLINHLFASGPPPACGGDADGNGVVNVSDVLYLINFLFAGGPAPL